MYSLPAIKRNERWEYPTHSVKTYGPHSTLSGFPAAIGVSRNGSLRLFYHKQQWLELRGDLGSISSVEDLLSHAAFVGEPGQ